MVRPYWLLGWSVALAALTSPASQAAEPAQDRSVAVLTVTAEPDFADGGDVSGLSYRIGLLLAADPTLRVAGGDAAAALGDQVLPAAAAQALSVRFVFTGRAGGDFGTAWVSAAVYDATVGATVWSAKFLTDADNMANLPIELASAINSAIHQALP